jgi:hypothetical protein
VCNAVPVADAGGDRQVSYNTTVRLDGTHSSDPDGSTLLFHWSLDSKPAGSVAALDDATNPTPAFLADVIGDYVFTLTVDDTVSTSEPTHIVLSARNDAPAPMVTVAAYAITNDPLTLDGSGTIDANSDPLAFTWTVAGPPGSTAVPADPTAATTTLVPDVDGAYEISLAVDDGRTSAMVTKPVHTFHRLTDLPDEPFHLDYDRPLDRLLFTTRTANALYVFDPSTETLSSIALPQPPGPFSISPDGTRAVVADATGLTNVDLQAMTVIHRVSIGDRAADVVDGGDGWAYVFPSNTYPELAIRGVRLSDGAVTVGARAIQTDMTARLRPGTTTLYATQQVATEAFTFANGMTTLAQYAQSVGTQLWTSDDGTHVFSSGPAVYDASLTAVGQLNSYSRGVTASSVTGMLLAIPASADAMTDEVLDVYSFPGLVYDHSVTLPADIASGSPVPVHGRYVFMHADGMHYTAVVQVEPLSVSPGHYAVTTF